MDAVSPADAWGVLIFHCLAAKHCRKALKIFADDLVGLLQ